MFMRYPAISLYFQRFFYKAKEFKIIESR